MTHRTSQFSAVALLSMLGAFHTRTSFAQQPAKQDAPGAEAAKPAPAKTEEQIKAGELFNEAKKLVQAGDYKQACPKFEQSANLTLGIGVQFNLADCWEHIGRAASAQALFHGVAASARAAGQAERAQVAQARAEALEPRLVRLAIDVKASDPELVVRRNRIVVEKKSWGAAVSVDSGDYTIEASAPGKKTWSTHATVPVTATEVIAVVVPPLEPAEPEKRPTAAPKVASVAVPPPPPVQHGDAKARRRDTYAYVIGGLGVVSVGLGTFFAVKYKSKNNDAKEICPGSVGCSQSDIDRHEDLVSDAKTFRTGAFIGFGVGAAALITSAALLLAPSSSTSSASVRAMPFVAADGSWGAVASGRF